MPFAINEMDELNDFDDCVSIASNNSTEIVNESFRQRPTGSYATAISNSTTQHFESLSLRDLFGENLIRNNGHETTITFDEAFEETKVIGLYFGDPSHVSYHGFTPILHDAYTQWKREECAVEIVFISNSQRKDTQSIITDLHENHGPWLALNFDANDYGKHHKELHRVFDIISIPSLIFINKQNQVINANGIIPISQYGWRAAEQLLEQQMALEMSRKEQVAEEKYSEKNVKEQKQMMIKKGNKRNHHRRRGRGMLSAISCCLPCCLELIWIKRKKSHSYRATRTGSASEYVVEESPELVMTLNPKPVYRIGNDSAESQSPHSTDSTFETIEIGTQGKSRLVADGSHHVREVLP